jgi:hypothetical protein
VLRSAKLLKRRIPWIAYVDVTVTITTASSYGTCWIYREFLGVLASDAFARTSSPSQMCCSRRLLVTTTLSCVRIAVHPPRSCSRNTKSPFGSSTTNKELVGLSRLFTAGVSSFMYLRTQLLAPFVLQTDPPWSLLPRVFHH